MSFAPGGSKDALRVQLDALGLNEASIYRDLRDPGQPGAPMTARERVALVLLVLACVAEVVFGWLGIALLLFGAAVALGGRAQWIRHRGRGVI